MKRPSMEVCHVSTAWPSIYSHPESAQVYYQDALGIKGKDGWVGLVNGAPYLCCAFSCWLNYPLNKLLNRRGMFAKLDSEWKC